MVNRMFSKFFYAKNKVGQKQDKNKKRVSINRGNSFYKWLLGWDSNLQPFG